MDKCPKCNNRLNIANGAIEFEGDKSADTETIAYQVINKVCCNNDTGNGKPCDNYCGNDLSNPKIVVDTERIKLN